MRRAITIFLISCAVAVSTFAQAAKTTTSVDEALTSLRGDMQSSKADIMAKNITLTSQEAAKFWPLYEAYQKEQNAVLDSQLKGIQQYVDGYNTLDDATALKLINAHFDRDAQMNSLRKKWLSEFQKALGTKTAVRAMQIDRQLSLGQQFAIAAHIPLSH
jgi:Spy/CpxP family protein refolding chaperone